MYPVHGVCEKLPEEGAVRGGKIKLWGGETVGENIKKRSAHFIYYGVDSDTGAYRHISEVQRGIRCNCKCARCRGELEARQGTERRYHFAHVSNYECLYAAEVAVYGGFYVVLQKLKQIRLPAITYGINRKDSQTACIDDVIFDLKTEEKAYPPMLQVSVRGSLLRIVLNFGYYYKEKDKEKLALEAKDSGYSVLMYQMPSISNDSFSPDELANVIIRGNNAHWVYSKLKEKWKEKYSSSYAERAVGTSMEGTGAGAITEEKYRRAQQKVISTFDPYAKELTVDEYGRRWIMCKYCKEIKQDNKMVTYGGTDGANLGVCSDCVRKIK